MTKTEAISDVKKILSDLVYNMTSHEGNPITLSEVRKLLGGGEIDGHDVSDEQQVFRIKNGWEEMIRLVENNQFQPNKKTICYLHNIYAKEEALTWGEFRTRIVTIRGTEHMPPDADSLDILFDEMIDNYHHAIDKDDASYDVFLSCAMNQYFNDGNKRAGQFLMNGARLSLGLPAITIPAKRNSEYNQKMVQFYDSQDRTEMKTFLQSCRINAPVVD
ncbi:Fic family protein [Ostreibacterium oceani]|uniref:Cell filamentation protein Fic n=1 Tax=Ostreibacterium oceani TaxID=2654998 RepID=A0A6N7EX98_9GAMM|nr:Fic family protein [Ostreibacterium oceani]MPV86029.1 cell filamentation protein Fic [Ostreibacterium oceani]